MFKRIIKRKAIPERLMVPIAFIVMVLSIIYSTIASAALNATLQITGEARLIPDHTYFVKDFEFKNACEEYVIPNTGLYKLEVWGAEGGGAAYRGKGGYATGKVQLTQDSKIYVCVGGAGKANQGNPTPGGFNGGGTAQLADGNNGSGGGATDIRIGTNSLNTRVIVAGGGGGNVAASGTAISPQNGHGGGLSGFAGVSDYDNGFIAEGGTALTGGFGSSSPYDGSFGQGANGGTTNRAGGGGGWYGGGSTYIIGGGGSGFVFAQGVSTPGGYSLSSTYQLIDAYTVTGGSSMPSLDGQSTMIGKTGNGFAKLTFMGDNILIGKITYDKTNWTKQNVTATLSVDPGVIILNNGGSNQYVFNQNDSFTFQFQDNSGRTGTAIATVTWIDKVLPDLFTVTLTDQTLTSLSIAGLTKDQGGSGLANYYYSINNGSSWVAPNTSGNYTFTGLTQDTTYHIKMKAVDNAGNERITDSISATTLKITYKKVTFTLTPNLADCGQYQQGSSGTDNSSGLVSAAEVRATAGTSSFLQERNWTTTAGYSGTTVKNIVNNYLNANYSGWTGYDATAKLKLQINIDFNTGNTQGDASAGSWIAGQSSSTSNMLTISGGSGNNGNHDIALRSLYNWNNSQTPNDFFIAIYVRKAGTWTDARTIRYYPSNGSSYVSIEVTATVPN